MISRWVCKHLDRIMGGLMLIILLTIPMGIYSCVQEEATQARLMQQCLKDDKKEYECVALLKQPLSAAPVVSTVPMFIR